MRRYAIYAEPVEEFANSLPLLPGIPRTASIGLWLFGIALLALGFFLAPAIVAYTLILLGLGVPTFLLVWRRPELGLLAIIFLTSSFLEADVIDVRLPIGGGLDLRDLVLLGMLGLLGLRGLASQKLAVPWWPVGKPLLLFLLLVLFSAFYALFYKGVEANWALNDVRILSYYAVFFLAAWAIKRPRQLAVVLIGLFIIADLTATIVILQQFFGADNPLLVTMTGGDWQVWDQADASGGFGAVRIVPPGHVLMYFMAVTAFCLAVTTQRNRRQRILFAVQFIYINIGLLFTYTRAQWIAAVIALGLAFFILLPTYKAQLGRLLAVAFPLALLAFSLFGNQIQSSLGSAPFIDAFASRLLSIFTPSETLDSYSLEWRVFEAEEGLRAIRSQPWLGVAIGNSYRNVTVLQGEAVGLWTDGSIAAGEVSRFTRYLHSSYLSIAVKMGIPALIVFLWFCTAFLFQGWQLYKALPDRQLQGVVLAMLASFVGLLQWSLFHSHLMETESTSVVGLIVGLVGALRYMSAQTVAAGGGHSQIAGSDNVAVAMIGMEAK